MNKVMVNYTIAVMWLFGSMVLYGLDAWGKVHLSEATQTLLAATDMLVLQFFFRKGPSTGQ